MAKKGKEQEEVAEKIIYLEPETEALDELEMALSGLPQGDSFIWLYRWNQDKGGRPRFLSKMTPQEFDLEYIKDTYGGGVYTYHAKRGNETVKQGRFEIEGNPVISGSIPTNGQTNFSTSEFAASLLQEIKSLREEMNRKEKDTNQNLLATLLPLIIQTKNSSEDIEGKLLQKMAVFKEILNPSSGGNNTTAILDALKSGFEMASMNGNDNGGVNWLMILDKLKEPLTNLTSAMANGNTKVRTSPMTKLPLENKKPLSENPIPQNIEVSWKDVISQYMPTFIAGASRDADPDVYADLIELNIPSEQKDSFDKWILTESWFTDLIKIDERVSYQGAWWNELRDVIKERNTPDAERSNIEISTEAVAG